LYDLPRAGRYGQSDQTAAAYLPDLLRQRRPATVQLDASRRLKAQMAFPLAALAVTTTAAPPDKLLDLPSIRDATSFFRGPHRLTP
jgi:hypothetical protein